MTIRIHHVLCKLVNKLPTQGDGGIPDLNRVSESVYNVIYLTGSNVCVGVVLYFYFGMGISMSFNVLVIFTRFLKGLQISKSTIRGLMVFIVYRLFQLC